MPACNGEVVALDLLLSYTHSMEANGMDADIKTHMMGLPSHRLDSDFDLVK